MLLKDFPDKIDHTYFNVPEFRQYLADYLEHFELGHYINYNSAVTKIEVNSSHDSEKHWKVSVKQRNSNDEETEITEYFDFVVVANGHNSVPSYSKQGITNIEKFKGLVMHAHNFRTPHAEEFKDKNILIIGAKVSGGDILMKFCGDCDPEKASSFSKIYINQGKFGFLNQTTNLRQFIDDGKLVIKQSKLDFTEDSVKFDDEDPVPIDVVIYCTGYQFSYPFLTDSGLIEVDTEQRFLYPLFKRYFCANDPTLMFPGVNDGPTAFTFMEQNTLMGKYFIKGTLKLPNFDEMIKDIEDYKTSFNGDLRACYQPHPMKDLEEYENVHKFLTDNCSDEVPPLNAAQLGALKGILWKMWVPLSKGDLKDFKEIDISGYPF